MILKNIKLVNFKNYAHENFIFSEKMNCIVGNNGMGKTNLLDAIYYCCVCKSRFSSSDKNVIRKCDDKEDFFRLDAQLLLNKKEETLAVKIRPGSLKTFIRNDVEYQKLTDHIGIYPVVFIVPDDANLLVDGSESRRLLMDNALSQLSNSYLNNLLTYKKLLKQRNALLKSGLENGKLNLPLLESYDLQLTPSAEYLHEARLQFVEGFSPLLHKYYALISEDSENISCKYRSQLKDNDFKSLLNFSREKDRVWGRTTSGVHKDDLVFYLNNFPLKRFASQGQLKSFLLAVKLAQYVYLKNHLGEKPLLLLDDIFDKLDDRRVTQLLKLLHDENFGQIFISDTHEQRAEKILKSFSDDFKKIVIANGKVIH